MQRSSRYRGKDSGEDILSLFICRSLGQMTPVFRKLGQLLARRKHPEIHIDGPRKEKQTL